jgi:hypothetical protein
MTSILTTIKKLLGLDGDDTAFDTDVIIHINSAFSNLYQLGVGTSTPFSISNASSVWSDFLGESSEIESVKTYIYFRVKLAFDPPQNSFLVESINKQITELEWRLNIQSDIPAVVEEGDIEQDVWGE